MPVRAIAPDTMETIFISLIAAGVFAYLLYAMLHPEKF